MVVWGLIKQEQHLVSGTLGPRLSAELTGNAPQSNDALTPLVCALVISILLC